VARFAYADIFPPEAPPPTYESDLARWQHWLGPDREQGRRAHVARTGQGVVGVILAGPDPDDPTLGHIARLYVEPSCWGRGVGTLLYRAALDDLTGRNFLAATLWVLEANHRARDWYERLGWRTTGRRHAVYAPAGIDDVQYRIELSPGRSGARRRSRG
jgi:ribosomal protein S18 acetylase RimI-like enzyme